MKKNESPKAGAPDVVPPGQTLVLILMVLGILPWAYYWINVLAPKTGFAHWTMKGHLIFILGVPSLLMWMVSALFFRRK